MTSISRSNGL